MTTCGATTLGAAGALAQLVAALPAGDGDRGSDDDRDRRGARPDRGERQDDGVVGRRAIEATLLDSDAVLQAGDTIRRLAIAAAGALPDRSMPRRGPAREGPKTYA